MDPLIEFRELREFGELAEFREFRGKQIAMNEGLDKSDDILWEKYNDFDKKFNKQCIVMENRITKLEDKCKELDKKHTEEGVNSRWIWGLRIAVALALLALVGNIVITLLH